MPKQSETDMIFCLNSTGNSCIYQAFSCAGFHLGKEGASAPPRVMSTPPRVDSDQSFIPV